MRKAIVAMLALMCAVALSRTAYADNDTEFGIEDDLTVLGTGGTSTSDPDVEIKGFTVFGSTEADHDLNIPKAPGNIFVNGYVQISSGVWAVGPSTFTGTVNLPVPESISVSGGAEGEVMTKYGTVMKWSAVSSMVSGDNLGNHIATTTLQMSNFGIINVASITANGYIQMSSATVSGNAGIGGTLDVAGVVTLSTNTSIAGAARFWDNLQVSSNTLIGGSLGVTGAAALDSTLDVTGVATLGGALNVTGNSTLTGTLNVNNEAYFGAAASKSTFTATGDLVMFGGADITLSDDGKVIIPAAPQNDSDAVNKAYVDNLTGSNSPWVRDDAIHAVKLSTITDNVGVGIAVPTAKLHVSSANAADTDMLIMVSSGTSDTQQVFQVRADGNSQMGNNPAADHAINMAAADGTALAIAGEDAPGKFITKFYSGANVAAWIKRK